MFQPPINDQPANLPRLSIVVPVFEELDNLRPLCTEIEIALSSQAGSYEIVLIDDGSSDGSLGELRSLAAEFPSLRLLASPKNLGQSAALLAGFQASRGASIISLDADLQNDPADIPRLLDALADYDVVSGVRARRQDSVVRRVSSRIANRARRWVTGDSIHDVGCSLKAYRASWLRDLPRFNGLHRFLPCILELRGARLLEISVNHRPRIHGVSKYGVGNRLWRGLADLFGVRWLAARHVALESYAALEVGATPPRLQDRAESAPNAVA